MINFLYRLLLTFNATSLILVIYAVKEKFTLDQIHCIFYGLSDYVSYLLYFATPIFLTYLSLLIAKFLESDDLKHIVDVEQANNAFLPSYLGYFFVALSIPYFETLIFVFGILFVFTFLSQTLYFNPLFLFFKYHFYYITTDNNVKNFIITKKVLKKPSATSFTELKRINNFTFIDKS